VGKYGGTAMMMKSGIGTCFMNVGAVQIGAVVAVNALGDVYENGRIIAGMRSADGGYYDTRKAMTEQIAEGTDVFAGHSQNTTIGVVFTNAEVTKPDALRIASASHNGLARAINPLHTSADGDTMFSMHSGKVKADADVLSMLAAEAAEQAVIRAVKTAEPAYGVESFLSIRP
jgi:L-aminopeptidase/D-esterase-like protein